MVRKASHSTEETIHKEYGNNVRIVEYVDDRLEERRWRFEAMTHVGKSFPDPSLAELYADVYAVVDSFREEHSGRRGIPPAVAWAGKDVMTAYMVAEPTLGHTWTKRFTQLDDSTIRSYVSRVRSRAKDAREEWDDVTAPREGASKWHYDE